MNEQKAAAGQDDAQQDAPERLAWNPVDSPTSAATPTQSDTPRTDEEEAYSKVIADFARQLERDLAAERKRADGAINARDMAIERLKPYEAWSSDWEKIKEITDKALRAERAEAELAALREKYEGLLAALKELVRLKHLKDTNEYMDCADQMCWRDDKKQSDYLVNKPLAWKAAEEALRAELKGGGK